MKKKLIALAVAGLASMSAAHAEEPQKNMFYLGVADLTVHSDAGQLTSNGPAFLTPPASLSVHSQQTVMFGYVRRIDPHFAFELALGVPPKHDVTGTGALAPYGLLAQVKQAAPTAFLDYAFGEETDKLRPFVGVGINFTKFYDAQSTASNNLAAGGPTKIRLSNSVGPALQGGVTYRFAPNWSLNSALAWADVGTNLTSTTGSIERKTHIDFRPIVWTLTVGYRF